jgi:molecular chaperone DnaK (HSP70)
MNRCGRFLCAALLLASCKKDARPPSLGKAVAIEQPGGTATQLISQGSEIPTSATESFTTAKDDERRIALHVLRGSGRSAAALSSEGWWVVEGVSSGKAGEPRVLVTFEVDAQGALSVSAREEDRKLKVGKVDDDARAKLSAAPLSEPDEGEDSDEDPE